MLEIISGTPWWVYAIFFVLVSTGLNSLRHRKINVKQLLIVPIVLGLWNLGWLGERIHGHFTLLSFWILGIGFGFFIGEKTVSRWVIRGDKDKKHILLPPTYSTMILIVIVFCIRYFFYYNYIKHPETAPNLYPNDAAISGILTGVFIGRTVKIFKKFKIL